ncbi:lethal giant larvae like, C-terminal-domain-containing protein [Amylostereum chailletii]|nr:lethal giant larvae like, C-terminal-domain-containing protein [Amylostereum chailletii]
MSVVFGTGHIAVYRLAGSHHDGLGERILEDKELVSLEHIPVADGLRFKPFFMVLPPAQTSAYAASEIGFCAAAYVNGAMYVIDMRGPKVLLRVGHDQGVRSRHHILPRRSSSADPIVSLSWTICSLRPDPTPKLRLIAIHLSAATHTYTLERAPSGEWTIAAAPSETETIVPLEGCTFVLDARTGAQCKADKNRLSIVLDQHRSPDLDGRGEDDPRCFLIVAGSKGARCYGELNGDSRISKAEWGSKAGVVLSAQIIDKNRSRVLVAITDKHNALVYSLPGLDHLHTVPLPTASTSPPSFDTAGDILTLISASTSGTSPAPARRMVLDTFFNVRRGYYTPIVSLIERRDGGNPSVAAQPYPVSMGPSGWLSGAAGAWLGGLVGTGSMTGAQIDALRPDRPIPEKTVPQGRMEKKQYADWEANKTGNLASSAAQTQSSLYSRLQAVVAERG